MLSSQAALAQFKRKVGQFPFLSRFLGPSLKSRLETKHWYENRIIRYVLRDSPWIGNLEATFQQADVNSIPNAAEIFSVLQGTEADYDEQLLDAITEVRLIAWARTQGYQSIEKLKVQSDN